MTALKTKLIVLILTIASVGLAGGGSGGGVAAIKTIKYVIVEVCDGGESGDRCRLVTYKVRAPNPVAPDMCMVGNAGEEKPCSEIKAISPSWLKKLGTSTIESTEAVSNPDIYGNSGGN